MFTFVNNTKFTIVNRNHFFKCILFFIFAQNKIMYYSDLTKDLISSFEKRYNILPEEKLFHFSLTKREIKGDITLILFPFAKKYKIDFKELADFFTAILKQKTYIKSVDFINGYLNITFTDNYWFTFIKSIDKPESLITEFDNEQTILIEYASPNTNKPLHLGHIRNVLLGSSLANLLKYKGYNVVRLNLINDRGIHICKSMLAWKKWGNGITPENSGKKGDHLVGDFYVKFENELKKQIDELLKKGLSEEQALREAPLMKEAQQMLRDWENGDPEVLNLWKMMNNWVLEGFQQTFNELGIEFDKVYYESEIYKLGKQIIFDKLKEGIVNKDIDNSIYIDLSDVGLDKKILIRSDGTSVYITQDIANAVIRYDEFKFNRHLYVVANEQIYHFKVLREVLKRFGYFWYNKIEHYSYGMVELPEGKMKSREGKVVDADDLIDQMYETAKIKTEQLGKLNDISEQEKQDIIKKIGLAALKYFILKVDPKKNMLFNPNESIDFEGNTGPFILYTYTRIQSLIRKSGKQKIDFQIDDSIILTEKEKYLILDLYSLPEIIDEAVRMLSPAHLTNYLYRLAKDYNAFYQELPILKAEKTLADFRLYLSAKVADTLRFILKILGIEVINRM